MATKKRGGLKGFTQKSGDMRPTKTGAGMTKKGVAKYRRQNPGSKLKTAVTEKSPSKARAKRRKSFCEKCRSDEKNSLKLQKIPIAD